MCPYVRNGFCPISKGLFEIDTKKGGTNRFGRHITEHEKGSGKETRLVQELPSKCRQEIADAAALAVVLDVRPLGFAENKSGMEAYAGAVFRAGQSVPNGVVISSKSYLPSRTAVNSSVSRLANDLRKMFAARMERELKRIGGAITIDGLSLKLQGRHYYDFTLHYISIQKPKTVVDAPKFGIETSTILFLEGPNVASAENIRSMLNSH